MEATRLDLVMRQRKFVWDRYQRMLRHIDCTHLSWRDKSRKLERTHEMFQYRDNALLQEAMALVD